MEMAFRSEAQAGTLLIAFALAAHAQTYQVRHRHTREGGEGILRVSEQGIAFEEGRHSRQWKFEDIQWMTLGPTVLRILSYESAPFGRDRQFVFDRLPDNMAAELYGEFRNKLDRRFVAALADDSIAPLWQIPARQGELQVAADRVVYRSALPEQSRTWRIADIESVSTAGPFDLTVTTEEREFHFQLKRAITDEQYNYLWRAINRAHGLRILTYE
jgi:hypothetical protein